MYRLHDFLPSGNGYKVRLVLKQLGIPYEYVDVDILNGASRTPAFLAINPNGRVPVLEVPGKGYLAESHAIMFFLAYGSPLLPADRFELARMWQWMSFEQYNLEPNIGSVRLWTRLMGKTRGELGEKLLDKKKSGYAALDVLELGLTDRDFLVNRYSLADISLYAYTHVSAEGEFDLTPYPKYCGWLKRVESQPGWAPLRER